MVCTRIVRNVNWTRLVCLGLMIGAFGCATETGTGDPADGILSELDEENGGFDTADEVLLEDAEVAALDTSRAAEPELYEGRDIDEPTRLPRPVPVERPDAE